MDERQGKKKGGRHFSARTHARVLIMQGLYQRLLIGISAQEVRDYIYSDRFFESSDAAYLERLVNGIETHWAVLEEALQPYLDRPLDALDPMEGAILYLGCYELLYCTDVPVRVILNEAIELSKSFGGTDGHRYVNGVLDRVSSKRHVAQDTQSTDTSENGSG